MSGDEFIAFCIALFCLYATWMRWFWAGISIGVYHQSRAAHTIVSMAVVAAVALLLFVLQRWASWDVRDSTVYISFYLLIGAGFTGIILLLFDRAGLSLRDDALERRNPAAAVALAGTTVGSMAAFAGANIGDGPGWWVVIFCALLSNGALLTGWLMLDRLTGMGEAITIDRDMAAAGRAAGWLTGGGIVFGRAAAGDWTHLRAAVHDFIGVAVGGLVLLGAAIVLERFLRSSGERRDALVFGGIPAGIYICGAIAYITRFHPL